MTTATEKRTPIVPGLFFQLLPEQGVGVFSVEDQMSFPHAGRALYLGGEVLFRHSCHVVLDLTDARVLHEAGLGLLSYAKWFMKKLKRRFAIVEPRDRSVLAKLSVDLYAVFPIFPSLEEAVGHVLAETERSAPASPA